MDMRHFFAMGWIARWCGRSCARSVGMGIELGQLVIYVFTGDPGQGRSAFNPEDPHSNAVGIVFIDDFYNSQSPLLLWEQMQGFFKQWEIWQDERSRFLGNQRVPVLYHSFHLLIDVYDPRVLDPLPESPSPP